MKTIKELVQDSDNLNKFMTQAAADKAENHLLAKIDDVYAREVYLTLLISVAEASGQFDESAENPLVYVCKIAAAFDKAPDMQEILRRSLLIDEKVLTDYSITLNQHGLQNLFLFDALTLMSIYAKDNSDALAYVTGIAEIFGTGKDGLQEILIIVKAVMNSQTEFSHHFQYINLEKIFLPLLRIHMKNISVESSDVFVIDFAELTDMTQKIPLNISDKKIVNIKNIEIHDEKKIIYISNCENVIFDGCYFHDIKYFSKETMFQFNSITRIDFNHCKFENLIGKRTTNLIGENIVPKIIKEGIIATLKDSEIYFDESSFLNCYYLDYRDRKFGQRGYQFIWGSSCRCGALISTNREYVYHRNCNFEEAAGFLSDG